jgi:hypothetical protein
MEPAKFNAGGLLKEMKAGIKAVAKEAGVNRGSLNNALLQAAPKSAEEVGLLLKNARQLVTDYEAKRAHQASRPKTPLETIIASITKGTKTSPSKLDLAVQTSGVSKAQLNTALMYWLGYQKEPTTEAAANALKDPKGLIDAYLAHKAATQKPAQQPAAQPVLDEV